MIFSLSIVFSKEETETQNVMSLKEIDRFIDDPQKRNFNKALIELNKFLNENPELFDAVQKRYKKILNSRLLYSKLAEELISLIKNSSEEDTEEIDVRIKKLTDEILSLEINPDDPRLEIVKDTNYLVSVRQYSAIQNKTEKLIQSKKYADALKKAEEGFAILYENFSSEYASEKVFSEVDSIVNEAKKNIALFENFYSKLESASLSYETALKSENQSAIQNAFENAKNIFTEYADYRNTFIELGLKLEEQTAFIKSPAEQKRKAQKEETQSTLLHGDEYPSLAKGVVLGWNETTSVEHGVLGVLDGVFNVYTEQMKEASKNALNDLCVQFSKKNPVKNFSQEKTLPNKAELLKLQAIGKTCKSVNGLYSLLKTKDGKGFEKPYQNYDLSLEYLINIAFYTEKFIDNALKISQIKTDSSLIKEPENPLQSIIEEPVYAQTILKSVQKLNTIKEDVEKNSNENSNWAKEYQEKLYKQNEMLAVGKTIEKSNTSGIKIEDRVIAWQEISSVYDGYISSFNDYCKTLSADFYITLADFYVKAGTLAETENENLKNQIQKDLDGSVIDGMKRRYPKNALQKINELEKNITKAKNALNLGLEKLSGPYQEKYSEQTSLIKQSILKLDSILLSISKTTEECNILVRRAEKNISDGNKNYENARKFFRQRKFDEARNAANTAIELYDESLRNNYDEAFAKKSHQDIEKLLSEISENQKTIIDKEVNDLISKATVEFNNDNYAESQQLLNQAQERWNVVFLDFENVEITNMLKIVENALDANNGREVLPSDSLYRDFSQMIRSAKQSFEKGKSLSKKGNTTEAEENFNEALKTLEIIRSIVPRNREANKLRLEIQQFKDPEQFEINFKNRVTQAKESAAEATKNTVDTNKLLQAYSDLSDLAEIKPNYPGLKQTILEIEYTLGKRKRPLEPAVKKQAQALANEAQRLYNNADYQNAFQKINQAIATDSSNAEYKTLRTKISSRLKTKVYTKDSNYADRYNEAVEFVSSNRYEMAEEIISEMWKNPANRTDNLLKLKNRVERALGL